MEEVEGVNVYMKVTVTGPETTWATTNDGTVECAGT